MPNQDKPARRPLAGTHGRYALIRKIADGGMAEIFLARQSGAEGFERTVIVKRILPALAADRQFRNMLVDEAHVAMTLSHSNIVSVIDLGRADGQYFLVMELVDGWDVATLLRRAYNTSTPLPLGLALHIVTEICRGLAYAQGRRTAEGKPLGIVHRDISPQNVLVSEQGEVKLADFGIAKALGKRELTRNGTVRGHVDFMSPEQASGAPVDKASDIYSVGSLLYLLATGRAPYHAESELETLLLVQRGEPPPPEVIKRDLAPGVAAVVKKAMQLLPSDRYRSAEDMLVDLETVLNNGFRPAGASELKRWLAEMGARDGAPPTSERPGLPIEEAPTGELPMGQALALEEPSVVSGIGRTLMFGGGEAPVEVAAPAGTTPQLAERRSSVGVFLRVLLVAVALAIGMTAFLSRDSRRELVQKARTFLRERALAASTSPQSAAGRAGPGAPGASGASADSPGAGSEARVHVTMRVVTQPAGATVKGPDGSLGRTPLSYAMLVGTAETLTFTKPGYAAVVRRISADPAQPTVVVKLVRQ